MSTIAESAATVQHRREQLAVRARLYAQLLKDWRLLDFTDLDGSAEAWLRAATGTVITYRTLSAVVAAAYLRAERAAQGVPGDAVIAAGPGVPTTAVLRSLMVTGPITVKHLLSVGAGSQSDVMDRAFEKSAGAASRHVLDGGRDTVMASVRADSAAVGWERVNASPECTFCSDAVGEISKSDSFASHDHCACSAAPVYRDSDGRTTTSSARG